MSQAWHNHAPPQGWQGQWPPPAGIQMPPGFPGPPPVPQNVQASAWQTGYWQFNPRGRGPGIQGSQYANSQPHNGFAWAPSNHWAHHAVAQQQNQNFNPHKKVPRAPEPTYFDYKLVDNPLGLEGMVPRDETRREHDGDGPQTPWIWNPPTLRETNERPVATREFPQSRRSLDAGLSGGQKEAHAGQRTDGRNQYNENSLADVHRRAAHTIPDVSRNRPLNANPMSGPPGPLSKIPAGFVPQQQSMPQHPGRHQSSSHQSVPPSTAPPGPPLQAGSHHAVRKSESFTEKKALHPTFSPQIVRTPDYYHNKNRDAANATTRQGNIYRPGGVNRLYIDRSQNAIDEMNGTLNNEARAQPLERQSSLPTSLSSSSTTMTGLANYTNEPTSLLSPVIGATPKASIGHIRSHTEPLLGSSNTLGRSNTLSAIPEGSSAGSNSTAICVTPPSASQDDATFIPLQPTRSRHPTPHPRRENPLPPPPVDIQRSVPSPQSQPPPNYSHRVRKGLWNKRGDHLTSDMHVVFAPADKAYPAELSRYPDGKQGYYDAYLKQHVPWIERPELPASLPHRGQPPTQPYETFVVYAYFP